MMRNDHAGKIQARFRKIYRWKTQSEASVDFSAPAEVNLIVCTEDDHTPRGSSTQGRKAIPFRREYRFCVGMHEGLGSPP